MIFAIRDGFFIGLGLSILLGPVFFTLIQTSMNRGLIPAIFLSIGISLSDLFCIAIVLIGLNSIDLNDTIKLYIGFFGGIVLILFGLSMVFKNKENRIESINNFTSKDRLKFILKGFFLNALNPSVILFWIATVTLVTIELKYDMIEVVVLFLTTIVTIFTSDILKSFLAKKIAGFLTKKVIKVVSLLIGLCLIGLGLTKIYDSKNLFLGKLNTNWMLKE
jgi:threonine/homoserine/homoserine lactone efflux protein